MQIRVDDVIASQFSIHFIYRNYKNLIFQYENVHLALHLPKINEK